MDTDGSVCKRRGHLRVCTKDPVFCGQIGSLLAGVFGLEAVYIEASWNKTYEKFYYRVGLTNDAGMVLEPYMRHPGKKSRLRSSKRLARPKLCTVSHVIDAGLQPTVDLQVESPQHTFLQGNFIGSNSVIFAINYGAGAAKVLESIMTDVRYDGPPLSLAMVERIMAAIFTAFPKVRTYKENTIAEAQSSGYLYDGLARRRRCFPLRDVPATEAANYRIQSSVASIIDMVLIELAHMLPQVDPSAFIVAQVHDAIYIEADEAKAPQVEQLLAAAMSQEIRFVPGAPWMPFPTIAKTAKKWSDL